MSERVDLIYRMILDHLRSPSLKHIRDPSHVLHLATKIVARLDRVDPIWRKWGPAREELARAAVPCWIPDESLTAHLNTMAGPKLTVTDVRQRVAAMALESYAPYPDEQLKDGCLAIYEREASLGTEIPAIIGLLNEFVEREGARLLAERTAVYRARQDKERLALEQRFHSGADCKWTPLDRSKEVYCRVNGRSYRLSPPPDKLWQLDRIDNIGDPGLRVGRYRGRREATAVVNRAAFAPDLR